MTKEFDVLWGAFFGMVLGEIIAKVYETWAILYQTKGALMSNPNGYGFMNGIFSTPLWYRANHQTTFFTIITVLLFGILGVLFVKYLEKRED